MLAGDVAATPSALLAIGGALLRDKLPSVLSQFVPYFATFRY